MVIKSDQVLQFHITFRMMLSFYEHVLLNTDPINPPPPTPHHWLIFDPFSTYYLLPAASSVTEGQANVRELLLSSGIWR